MPGVVGSHRGRACVTVALAALGRDRQPDHRRCHYTIERFARDFAASGGSAYTASLVLGIFEKGTGRALAARAFTDLKPGIHECEIGYWCGRQRAAGHLPRGGRGWLTPLRRAAR